MEIKTREAEKYVRSLARGYPAIIITGPRQSGKTTLARRVFKSKQYVSLENPDTREFASTDPRGFLEMHSKGAILDEVQRCPELFSYLQEIIDEKPVPGRFILTVSGQFSLLSGITQSLAGRSALIQLLPFTLRECYSAGKALQTPKLHDMLFAGLYPPVHHRELDPRVWYANYVQTYIERDVRQMLNVRDLSDFQRFVRLCAGRQGSLLNLSNLADDCGITHNTAKAWISILEASYIVFLLRPHHTNFNKRLIKTPKLYFYDTGLAAWLLSIQTSEQLNTHPMRGALFEGFILSEMLKVRYNQGLPSNLFFWRDRTGNEVDVLVDQGTTLQPIEIKSGKTLTSEHFRSLEKWCKLAGATAEHPMLIYGGDERYRRAGITVRSWRDRMP